MMAELEQNALLTEMRELLDFIGDGRRLTAAGTLYVVEKKEFHRSSSRAGAGGARNDWYEHRWLDERLDLLCRIGWLEVEERVLRTASVPAIDALRSGEPDSVLDAARELFAAVLRRTLPREPRGLTLRTRSLDLDALLIATGPDGLTLPWAPYGGEFTHCAEVVAFLVRLLGHPHIHEVPIARYGGHPEAGALASLASLRDELSPLVSWGILTSEQDHPDYEWEIHDVLYRAPTLLRGAVARVRDDHR